MFNKPIVPRFVLLLSVGMPNLCMAISSSDQIVAQVEQVAKEQLSRSAESAGWRDAKFEVAAVVTRTVPPCKGKVAVEAADVRQPTRMRLIAECPGADGWKYDFIVRAKVTATVAVMAADVPAGKPVAAADVAFERRDITLVTDTVADESTLLGMSARRSLRNGELLRQSMLVEAQVIKRGDPVRIVARREQIEVSMAGEALDPGARGTVIRVRNVSGTVIRARITGSGTVEPAELPMVN
ncbi:flagellar basal body P-ring formation protein FlgA [Duganella sp. FT92W]|uniref:Flagella basal body P-ring formation protein FlgA n=2 Tax=Pseudoduganella rivuli TaxID=2666085 RepID=A0A7X2IRG4_9BURK|nr:flagellar basal body P-ring formation protein FlgA [Pseudoduganella rivuli]